MPLVSTLSYWGGDIAEDSLATPGLFNRRLSALSVSINSINDEVVSSLTTGAPATSTSAGSQGQWAYNGTHWFVCTSDNSWARVAVAGY